MTEFSASLMCTRYENLSHEIELLEEAGVDSFHIDLMDCQFVPNLGMGLQDMQCVKRLSSKPMKVHMMVRNPMAYLNILSEVHADVIYIHPEGDDHPAETLERIAELGMTPAIALRPETTVDDILPLLPRVRSVIALMVTPGFAGKPFLPYAAEKIPRLAELKDKYGFTIIWDGSCTWDKIERYAKEGVDGFVMGTNVLFGKQEPYADLVRKARSLTL